MPETKYIIFENYIGMEYPVVFPETIQHISIASGIRDKVISAGFCSVNKLEKEKELPSGFIQEVEFKAYGKSISLNKESRPKEDTFLLNKMFLPRF